MADNLDLFGSYRQLALDFAFAAPETSENPLQSEFTRPKRKSIRTRVNYFEGLHKRPSTKFSAADDLDTKRARRRSEREEQRKDRRSQTLENKRLNTSKKRMAEVLHEVNGLLSEDDEIQGIEIDESTKRALNLPPVNLNLKKPENVVRVEPVVKQQPSKSNLNGNGGAKASAINNNQPKPSTSKVKPDNVSNERREKLMKWKKEKEEMAIAAQKNQKKPFKAGGAPPKIATAADTAAGKVNGKPVPVSARPAPPKIPTTAAAVKANGKPAPVTARPKTAPVPDKKGVVTRSMVKSQPVAVNGKQPVNGHSSKSGIEERMRNVNINDKSKPPPAAPKTGRKPVEENKAAPSRPTYRAAPAATSRVGVGISNKKAVSAADNQQKNKQLKPTVSNKAPAPVAASHPQSPQQVNSDNDASKDADAEPMNVVAPEEPKPAPVPVQKKAKPKAIDATYIDYNSRFSTACQKLNAFGMSWRKILEEEVKDKPEKIQSDILSALGKVKLLLESKLPQFTQLLYSYVCQDADPNPVLPCDLEGWWDVVSIQLEAVDQIFEVLEKQRSNNWESDSQQEQVVKKVKPVVRPGTVPLVKKAKASSGLAAFLAMQRKQQQQPKEKAADKSSGDCEPMVVDNDASLLPENGNLPRIDNEVDMEKTLPVPADKTFEGGFFRISSPKPTTPGSVLRRREKLTSQSVQDMSFNSGTPSRTPARRDSARLSCGSEAKHRRTSLLILSVRKSMGSMAKLGAVPISLEDRTDSTISVNEDSFVTCFTNEEVIPE